MFSLQIRWLVYIWNATLSWNELNLLIFFKRIHTINVIRVDLCFQRLYPQDKYGQPYSSKGFHKKKNNLQVYEIKEISAPLLKQPLFIVFIKLFHFIGFVDILFFIKVCNSIYIYYFILNAMKVIALSPIFASVAMKIDVMKLVLLLLLLSFQTFSYFFLKPENN